MASSTHSKNRVCYYYDSDIGNYYYGQGHPMKPHRIRMAHNLVLNYGLFRKMEIYRPHRATAEELTKFHSEDYIRFLRSIRPDNMAEYTKQLQRFHVESDENDCPVFDGLYEFCQISAGGSIAGAIKLNKETVDIAINWAGGLHHAKKTKASGFCYVNDIVLAILELLKYHQRVLYIDIDIHHGDGVEEAFYITDRVMTVSFHKYGRKFFPGTGDLRDIGDRNGKYYAINFPLRDGIDDESFESIFKPVMAKVMETYQPNAVVLQCGADSLTGDRLGSFNLTVKGHGNCVEFVKKYNLPLLLLGGGGYTIRNVARCWTYETAVALGTDIVNQLPFNDYFEHFSPDFKLHISPSNMANKNTPEYLNKIKTRLFENLRMLPCAPGVQMQAIPEDGMTVEDSEEEEEANPDERISIRASDKRVTNDNEFSDSEDEGEGGRRDQTSFNKNRTEQARQDEGSSNNGATEKKKESVKDQEVKDATVSGSPVKSPAAEEEEANPDERISIRASDKRVTNDEFSDSEDDGEGGRRDQTSFNKNRTKQARQDEGSSNNGATEKKEESVKDNEVKDATPVITPEKEKDSSGNGASKACGPQAPVKSPAAEDASSSMEVDTDSPQKEKETTAAAPSGTEQMIKQLFDLALEMGLTKNDILNHVQLYPSKE